MGEETVVIESSPGDVGKGRMSPSFTVDKELVRQALRWDSIGQRQASEYR